MSYFSKYFPQILFALISTVITLIWFRYGLMYGGAEVGLLTYNPQRSLEIQKFIWWASSAPGMLVPHYISGVPFYFLLSLFQSIFSPATLQAVIFFTLLFLMGIGMYYLSLSIVGEPKKIYAILAALFYMFNSYTMVVVWHRFLYTSFFLAAFLPILLLFWRKWINKGKFLFLALFLLTSLASSYMLGSLALIITVWLSLLLINVADIFPWEGKAEFLRKAWRFAQGAFFWLLTNIWWLIPFLTVSTGLLSEQHTSEDNINSLISISKQTIIYYLLQFANPFYLFYTSELGTIYNSLLFKILPWIPIIVIFAGLIVSLKRKIFAGFAVIYILVIFLSKGASTPFGYPYIWAFKNIYALGVIRNPFEKLGIMLPLFGSILFILGLELIFSKLSRKYGWVNATLMNALVILSVLIFAWPMFFGTVLKKPLDEVLIQVPDYYKQANEWFKSQKEKKGNILHLPFSGRDVVTYDWDFGYHGVDINEILFDSFPSITRNLGTKTVDETLSNFTYFFFEPFIENKDQLIKMLQNLDVSYIVVHKDVKSDDTATYGKKTKFTNFAVLENTLNNLDFLERKREFGKLVVYKLKDQFLKEKIILSPSATLVFPGELNLPQLLSLQNSKNEIVTPLDDKFDPLLEQTSEIFVFPKNRLDYSVATASALESLANKMQINSQESNFIIKQLQSIRDYFSNRYELTSEELVEKIIVSTKKLVKLQNDKKQNKELVSSMGDYQDSLKDLFRNNFKTLGALKLYRTQISDTFYLHLYILEQLAKEEPNRMQILSLHKYLIDGLKENDLLPFNVSDGEITNQEINQRVYRFVVPETSEYELLLIPSGDLNLYPELLSRLNIRINNRLLDQSAKDEKYFLSLGKLNLDQGTYEISYNSVLSQNLIPSLDKFQGTRNVKIIDKETAQLSYDSQYVTYVESPIQGISGNDMFKITFDVSSDSVPYFSIELIQDTEEFNSSDVYQTMQTGECEKHSCYYINLQPGPAQIRYIAFTSLDAGTRRANIRVNAFSTENSGNIFLKDLQVNKIFDGKLVLRRSMPQQTNLSSGKVTNYIRQSPTSYFGKIKLTKPNFLFFKEAFHPGWVLKLTQGDKVYPIDNHYLGNLYGNVYFIDKIGEYDFKLEFEPQKNADTGLIISLVGWILILAILLRGEFKRYEKN